METVAAKLPKSLLDAVDRVVAGGRFANRSEVFRAAVREFLETGRAGTATEADARRDRALRALSRDRRYVGRFVALHKDRVIDADDELPALVRRVLRRPEQPIHIERVTEGGGPAVARMPGVRVRT